MPASWQPAQQKQDLVIQAGSVACTQSRPLPGDTHRQAGDPLGSSAPCWPGPAPGVHPCGPPSLTQLPWKGCLQLPPPHLFSQPHLLGAVSSSSITRKAGQMPQGTFSWQSWEKTGIWAHGKSCAREAGTRPLSRAGSLGSTGAPPWPAWPGLRGPAAGAHAVQARGFTWVWSHTGHRHR